MQKLTRYLFSHLAMITIVVASGLTAAVWLTQSLRFVGVVLNKGFPLTTFFHLVGFMIPDLASIVLPIALFASVLFVYNRFINDSELVVMRAAGISDMGLAKPALLLAVTVALFMYFLNIFVLPESFRKFRDMEFEIKNGAAAVLLHAGEFSSFGDVTVYVREKRSNRNLKGIFIFDSRDKENSYALIAEQGGLKQTEEGAKIVLLNGSRQGFSKWLGTQSNKDTYPRDSMLYFDQYIFELKTSKTDGGPRQKKPYEMSLKEQLWPDSEIPSVQRHKLQIEAHQRLLWPLYAPLFTLIALTFLLNEKGGRRGKPKYLGWALLLVAAIQAVSFGLLQMSGRIPYTFWAVYMFIFGAMGITLATIIDSKWKPRLLRLFGQRIEALERIGN